MKEQKIIHFDDLDYIVNEEEDKYVLESTTKNEFGYYIVMRFPKNGDKNGFKNEIEKFLLREII